MEVGSKRLDDASDDSRNVSRPKRRIHGGKSSRNPHIDPIPLSILISYTCLNCHTFNHVGSVIIFMLVQREGGGDQVMAPRAVVHYLRLHLSLSSPSLS